jgi:hypothetical protein
MIKRVTFVAMIAATSATAALAQPTGAPAGSQQPSEPPSELKSLADTCAAHKFEALIMLDGRKRPSRVKICGEPGQTDAQWLVTLKDSVAKTEANAEMSASEKGQIVKALKAEIARLESGGSAAPAATQSDAVAIALKPGSIAPREPAPEYTTLPPLPAPKKASPARLSPGVGATATSAALAEPPPPPVAKPKLVVRCAIPHESFAACARLERESQLMVSAGEDVAAGTSLRFLRGGDNRAELDLGSLKKGDSLREKLPGRVCSGVLRGKVQLQVVTKTGQVADTMGPYALYCGS